MIQANDLRVNNLLIKHGEIVKVVDIGLKHISDKNYYIRCDGDNCGYWIDQFKPIPLTEEVLLKCGFVSKSIYDDFELNGFKIQSTVRRCDTNERSSFFLNLGEESESLNNRIDYLHQLQNLYWFLCGKELNVNI